jgi:hypothetical protein
MIQAAGRRNLSHAGLEHSEHDRADKRERDIRGNNAQLSDESHGETSLVHVADRCNAIKPFPSEKVSRAALSRFYCGSEFPDVVKKP